MTSCLRIAHYGAENHRQPPIHREDLELGVFDTLMQQLGNRSRCPMVQHDSTNANAMHGWLNMDYTHYACCAYCDHHDDPEYNTRTQTAAGHWYLQAQSMARHAWPLRMCTCIFPTRQQCIYMSCMLSA